MKYNAIVLAGLPGSGKSSLCNKLSPHFNWNIYSIGKLWREQYKILHPRAEISFENYWRNTTDEENKQMDLKLKEIVKNGNVVADTRFGFVCRDLPSVLLVYTMADLETRSKRALLTGKYPGKSLTEIKEILLKREMDEVAYVKRVYGIDYRDVQLYDICLNTERLTIEQELAAILSLMK